jgi:hypothetical protein
MDDTHPLLSPRPVSWWPLRWAVGMPLLLIGIDATSLGADFFFVLAGIPTLMGLWALAALVAGYKAVRAMIRGQWRSAGVPAVLPVTVIWVAFNFLPFIHFCNDAGDLTHWLIRRSAYLEAIQSMPANGAPRLWVLDVGGMIWSSRGYVYDESDEILLARESQSPAWTARAAHSELSCGYSARRFPGHLALTRHWYLVSLPC